MYHDIESDFKHLTKYNLFEATILIPFVMCIPIYLWVACVTSFITYLIVALVFIVLILIVAYLILAFNIRKEITFKSFFNVAYNINKYKFLMYDNDIKILKRILKKHHVDTQEKLLVVINHYQTLIPRNINSGGTVLSILAFSISALALILSENFAENITKSIVILLLIIAFCTLGHLLNKYMLKTLGTIELYKRLESSITEIYMSQKSDTTNNLCRKAPCKSIFQKKKKFKCNRKTAHQ